MERQLWELFRETGEPMGYLLYRSGEDRRPEQIPAEAQREGRVPACRTSV